MFNSNYILMIQSGRKKFFLNVFSIFFIGHMDNWTHRRTKLLMDNHQFPILTSIFFSNVYSIYFHWTNAKPNTQMNITFNGKPSAVQI